MPTFKSLVAGLAISTAMTGAAVAGAGAMTTAEASTTTKFGAATAPVVAWGRCHKIRRCGWGGWGHRRHHRHHNRVNVRVDNFNINNNEHREHRRHDRHHDDFFKDDWDW
ncbi:hypothetical protein E1286_12195 [Nonomuraea terrae]|uniref:Uncharacterized protein n=1 Tax=Nonomuraea terrae TaxID=2530383 RepID=A0A4R4Z0H8_9ACTN|nr:hypothetical protein [Nonomuraea terrae]TDD50424.1 hypothetical protein E1286_12195 [Nonomuraea terrae]